MHLLSLLTLLLQRKTGENERGTPNFTPLASDTWRQSEKGSSELQSS